MNKSKVLLALVEGEPLRKLDPAEAVAAGWYFALSNMGLADERTTKIVTKNAPNWSTVKRDLEQFLHQHMESDDMLDDAMPEVNSWIKQAKANDEYVVTEWDKVLAGKR